MRLRKFDDRTIRQARYLLENKNISVYDMSRILRYHISAHSIANIRNGMYNNVVGYEPPDDYEEYYRNYVEPYWITEKD